MRLTMKEKGNVTNVAKRQSYWSRPFICKKRGFSYRDSTGPGTLTNNTTKIGSF